MVSYKYTNDFIETYIQLRTAFSDSEELIEEITDEDCLPMYIMAYIFEHKYNITCYEPVKKE